MVQSLSICDDLYSVEGHQPLTERGPGPGSGETTFETLFLTAGFIPNNLLGRLSV